MPKRRTRTSRAASPRRVLLAADVGNSETTLGVYEGDALRAHWRIMTDVPRTADEFGLLLRQMAIFREIAP